MYFRVKNIFEYLVLRLNTIVGVCYCLRGVMDWVQPKWLKSGTDFEGLFVCYNASVCIEIYKDILQHILKVLNQLLDHAHSYHRLLTV